MRCGTGLRLRLLLRDGGDKLLFANAFPAGAVVVGVVVAAVSGDAVPVENLRTAGGDLNWHIEFN